MLAAKFRFHGYGALRFLFGHGKTYRFKSVSLRVAHNARRVNSRLAVIVSKKVSKAAPKRNRMRRRIYEVMRTHWPHVAPAHDIVLTVYDVKVAEMPAEELNGEIIEALQRAHVWVD